jgi:hypothetical protein
VAPSPEGYHFSPPYSLPKLRKRRRGVRLERHCGHTLGSQASLLGRHVTTCLEQRWMTRDVACAPRRAVGFCTYCSSEDTLVGNGRMLTGLLGLLLLLLPAGAAAQTFDPGWARPRVSTSASKCSGRRAGDTPTSRFLSSKSTRSWRTCGLARFLPTARSSGSSAFIVGGHLFPADQYPAVKSFYQAVNTASDQQIAFKRAAAPVANSK